MPETPQKDQLDALQEKIDALKGPPPKEHMEEHYSQAQLAWRMVIELVAGLGIGFGMGFGLDWALGTTPLFLVIFIFLGLAAGVKTMLRSAEEIQKRNSNGPTPQDVGFDDEEED